MPLNFTVRYRDRVNDVDDAAGDVAETPGVGWIYFDLNTEPGARIPVRDFAPEPRGLGVRTFTGYLDTDGLLKHEPGGEEGLRLWANDPAFDVARLQYRVRAELTDLLGRPLRLAPFYFDAPTTDTTVYLALEMPRPGLKFNRGRPGFGFARDGATVNEDGQLVLTREDGQPLGAVTIPDLSAALDEANAVTIAHTVTFGR